jgi:uncharacterized membrane protein YbhN (UPF0104 family)
VKSNLKKYGKLFLKLAVTTAALYYVFHKIDVKELWQTAQQSNVLLLLASLAMFVASKAVSSVRLNRYIKSVGINLTELYNLKLYLLGMYYNLFLPGGIGGDGYKIYLLNKKYDVKTSKIFWAVMLDRVIGVLALFCMAVLLSYFIVYPIIYKYFTWILIPLSIGVSYWVYKRFFKDFAKIFFKTNLQSLWVQILQTLSALLILYSLKVYDHTMEYLFVFLISSIVAVLPLTIGGLGSREITFAFCAQFLGLNETHAVTLSFLFYAITVFSSSWGIIYSLKPQLLGNPEESQNNNS